MNKKPYKDWTQEEKDAYEAKRKAWKDRRKKQHEAKVQQLIKELEQLNVPANVLELARALDRSTKAAVDRVSYLTALFGTETPKVGQKSKFMYVGVRGPHGERMNDGETMKQFVERVGDAVYKYDARSIYEMVHKLNQRGVHKVVFDRQNVEVRYEGQM